MTIRKACITSKSQNLADHIIGLERSKITQEGRRIREVALGACRVLYTIPGMFFCLDSSETEVGRITVVFGNTRTSSPQVSPVKRRPTVGGICEA